MTNKPTTIHKAFGLEDKFYIGENKTAQDKTISFELIGLIAYLSSLPNNWKINAGDIMRAGCGRNKAYKMLKELQSLGFLDKVETRNADGTFQSVAYFFYALREENQEYDPFPQKQDTDNQDTDNQLLQRKEVKKEKKLKTIAPKSAQDNIKIIPNAKKQKPAEHLGIAFGVMPTVKTDWSLYTKTCNILAEAGIEVDGYGKYIEWVRCQSKSTGDWIVSVPSLTAKGRISTYIQSLATGNANQEQSKQAATSNSNMMAELEGIG